MLCRIVFHRYVRRPLLGPVGRTSSTELSTAGLEPESYTHSYSRITWRYVNTYKYVYCGLPAPTVPWGTHKLNVSYSTNYTPARAARRVLIKTTSRALRRRVIVVVVRSERRTKRRRQRRRGRERGRSAPGSSFKMQTCRRVPRDVRRLRAFSR